MKVFRGTNAPEPLTGDILMFWRLLRFCAAVALSVTVIVLVGVIVMLAFKHAWWLFLLFLIPPVPNPMMLIVRPWSLAIKKIHEVLLKVQFVVETDGLVGLKRNAPTVCVCNHPPAAFFPILVWAVVTHVCKWPLCVSKAKNLLNPFLVPVIYPALVMKALVVTKRGNSWSARMVGWMTKRLVTKRSALIIFADAHRPESDKARKDYEKMREKVPVIEWHDRLGAYHWPGTYAAAKALGPGVQFVSVSYSFPRGAVGWLAPWRAYKRNMAFRIRNETARFQPLIGKEDPESGKPNAFIEQVNVLATETDTFVTRHNP